MVKIVSFDPALSNLGIALMDFDIESGKLSLEHLTLVQTEPSTLKGVRKNSDDLERARVLREGMRSHCVGRVFAIAEVPTGTQSARGAMSNGIVIGALAGIDIPLVQVTPREAKLAGPGKATATKGEMIEWAIGKYPHPDWLMRKSKGILVPINDNEHLADAIAIAEAGVKTDQFKQAMAIYSSLSRGT